MASDSADSTFRDLDWLADLHKSQCFTTSEVSCPAKSSDFGADGYTASLTDWHELLQLTAPDETCGLVFLRGQFPNTADAILARAQRRDDSGSKGTLGTRLQPAELNTDLELGERRVQGWINLKWPYSQYELKKKTDIWDGSGGTLEQISFIRSGTIFQILRLQWGHGTSLSDYDSADAQKHTITLRAGGIVQFGCPCSNGGPPNRDTFTSTSDHHGDHKLSCLSGRYQKRLEMRLFINGVSQNLAPSATHLDVEEVDGHEIDLTSHHKIELLDNEPVFIVSTYALKHVDDEEESCISGYFSEIEDHLGISNTSVNMTDRLWTACCSTNYEAYEAVEICVIGRTIEQIISVAAIPFSDKSSQHRETQSRQVLEIALVDNVISSQHVDVQSAFFQIRVLVKVYNHIATRHFEPDLLERFQTLDAIRTAYLGKLRNFTRASLAWLINTEIKPSKLLLALGSQEPPKDTETHPSERLAQCERDRVSVTHDQSYNQACYATLAVWYVIKHCPQAIDDDFKSTVLLPKLLRAFDVVQKRASRDKEPTPKNDVLQWFHLSCFYLICSENFQANSEGEVADGFNASGLDSHEVLKTQQKFEKYVSRLKTSQIEAYSIEHEELHRVILLGEELGLDAIPTQFTSSLAASRALQTRRWLAERKRTTKFNPGPASWKTSRITSNGPWELLSTNHQSFLRITDDANIIAARNRLFEFMMSDFTFMASWDYADSNMVGSWWNQEPGSVITATLIDLRMEGKSCSLFEMWRRGCPFSCI
ncbi:uncharacterized protein LY89DRAFT_765921 [Mollisia scopiformis]|uniref:Uncharacterized protein n=1 Tax=Mollisia scopiformis TaxID=149040 RepID=A0A132B7L0_MOLSC|nr:uncharacterized protein LY89DRAFT_765921 [Mollisia scopiformis]KUJ07864.1 hypothetical protein LY89DRAFT_765921 [Mollisia scopiformis]